MQQEKEGGDEATQILLDPRDETATKWDTENLDKELGNDSAKLCFLSFPSLL